MKLYGLQKMTLLDYPGHVACTVFTGGCDFRCPFCHNYELATGAAPAVMESGELLAFLKKRQGLLDGVAITGGEPCLQRELPALMRDIRALGFKVKLDTNGAHPGMLAEILAEGLADYVAMDVKNSPGHYALTCGVKTLDLTPIRESVQLLMQNSTDYEFRTTVLAELHRDADIEAIGEWIRGARRWFIQPFTDRDTVPYADLRAPDKQTLLKWAELGRRYVPETAVRGLD